MWVKLFLYVYMFIFFPKAETRAEFAERTVAKLEKSIDDLEGTLLIFPLVATLIVSLLSLLLIPFIWFSDLISLSLFSLFPCATLHFPLNLLSFLPCLTFDLQTNCTLKSWNTRLSARSWIMPSMIWTPCKPCFWLMMFSFSLLSPCLIGSTLPFLSFLSFLVFH